MPSSYPCIPCSSLPISFRRRFWSLSPCSRLYLHSASSQLLPIYCALSRCVVLFTFLPLKFISAFLAFRHMHPFPPELPIHNDPQTKDVLFVSLLYFSVSYTFVLWITSTSPLATICIFGPL